MLPSSIVRKFRIVISYPARFSGSGKQLCLLLANQGVKTITQLTIIANIHAKLDQIDRVKAELEKLIPITRAEEGCIQYDLYRDNENPAHFTFFENWESRELWQIHMNAPHFAAYAKATEDAVAEFTLSEMSEVG